jgi:dTDP-4-amino-4,6-dideoxygalactose transaminase
MQRYGDSPEQRTATDRQPRRFRLVPPAITPLRASDIAAGSLGQLRGRGRDAFRRDVESFLDAGSSATYTSFRRTLAGCFHELAADTDRTDVLVPAFCSSDFPDAIEGVGLEPVRYDIDPETLSLDLDAVARALDDDTLAVVAVNVLGYSSPMGELADRCDEHDVPLVEALGYAFGTEYEGQRLGTFGDCAVLNFQQGKPIPVGGGMVVSQRSSLRFSDDMRPAAAPNLTALAGYTALSHPRPYYAYTRVRDALDDADRLGERATTHPESKFDVAYEPPFATISNFQGAVAHRLFDRLADHRRQRTRTAERYAAALAHCEGVSVLDPIPGLSNVQYVRLPVAVETEHLRDTLVAALGEVGVQATTLYDWPVLDPEEFPGAADLQRRILTLPTHPYVDGEDRRLIIDTVRRVAAERDDG